MQSNTPTARCYHASNFAIMLAPPVTAYTTAYSNHAATADTAQWYRASIDASILTSTVGWCA